MFFFLLNMYDISIQTYMRIKFANDSRLFWEKQPHTTVARPTGCNANAGKESVFTANPTEGADDKKGGDSFAELGEKIVELIQMMTPAPPAPPRRSIHQPMRELLDLLAVLNKKAAKELEKPMPKRQLRDGMTQAEKGSWERSGVWKLLLRKNASRREKE